MTCLKDRLLDTNRVGPAEAVTNNLKSKKISIKPKITSEYVKKTTFKRKELSLLVRKGRQQKCFFGVKGDIGMKGFKRKKATNTRSSVI